MNAAAIKGTLGIGALALTVLGGAAGLAPAAGAAVQFCGGLPATIVLEPGGAFQVGTMGDDVVVGTEGTDEFSGLAGDDTICLLGGDDFGGGYSGDDRIFGGGGNDRLYGDADDDELYGQKGSDRLYGEQGTDLCDGGTGKGKDRTPTSSDGGACDQIVNVP